MRKRREVTPDQLLAQVMHIMQMDVDSLEQEADVGALEPERARILIAYHKGLVELQREMRQTMKDADPKKMDDEQLRKEIAKFTDATTAVPVSEDI